ncbi:isochorismate synthase [Oscillatoria sp. FACHB-1407]|uniref:isochorismate synthase n=1 Tax=Oscillatoria sp. FACHB-1407 TaxID=2692847 RepID=UPI0016878D3A|nr:isochorismate synthase [Oscillatoria sp. FACHB-1407]MBD2461238.1 isochorismate synthase [Oscillatoria sp. FACHB-1407]
MKVFEMIRDAVHYLSEGATRIFKPSDDHYPETGVQPFEGEPYSQWVELQNTKNPLK